MYTPVTGFLMGSRSVDCHDDALGASTQPRRALYTKIMASVFACALNHQKPHDGRMVHDGGVVSVQRPRRQITNRHHNETNRWWLSRYANQTFVRARGHALSTRRLGPNLNPHGLEDEPAYSKRDCGFSKTTTSYGTDRATRDHLSFLCWVLIRINVRGVYPTK